MQGRGLELTRSKPVVWALGRWPAVRARLMGWLRCGMTPRQLAFTLALGFAIGCFPVVGVTTAICALAALVLRLNMPAIQAANWAAMPLQLILLIPFMRVGLWLSAGSHGAVTPEQLVARMQSAPWHAVVDMSGILARAVLAWGITAAPALLLMTLLLTPLMHRVARRPAAEAGD